MSLKTGGANLYADDTAITVTATCQNELENKLSAALGEVTTWMMKNKLTVNTKKTQAMCFGTKCITNQLDNTVVRYEGTTIDVVDSYKYLGVVLDPNLTFSKHVEYLEGKIIGRLRMMSKL